MSTQYILYEHAAGYALFTAEPDAFLARARDVVSDVNKFKEVCEFSAFQPFKRGRDALENLNSISENIIHPQLEDFVISSLPKKKNKFVLGVVDPQLAKSFTDDHGIVCNSTEAVKELVRGIRFHFQDLVPSFGDLNASNKVQLGLAHAYSRSKVKFNVSRVDNMIIQTITLLDQLDKDINNLSMRIREWYSHHFPELIKIVPENSLYIQCINAVRDRKNMTDDATEQLQNILNDPNKVQNIIELARSSMGMDIAATDLENMYIFVDRVLALIQRRKDLTDYLKSKMDCVAPNLAALIGDFVGARLIAQAGSLTNLAKAPASTVQILGAEKALFRALKTRGNTPKYGLLFHSKFISKAPKNSKGRISRYLANKCSVASRLDCFLDIPTNIFGNKLKEQVEERLKFYETGDIPEKNTDIMDRALAEVEESQREIIKKMKIEGKQAKKRKLEELYLPAELDKTMASLAESAVTDEADTSIVKKKKKKKHRDTLEQNDQSMEALDESRVADEVDTSIVKRKKKKRKLNDSHCLNDETTTALTEATVDEVDTSLVRKKKKKHHNDTQELNEQSMEALDESTVADEADTSVVKKKKKKHNDTQELNGDSMEALDESTVADEADTSVVKKKKKKKKKKHNNKQEM